MKDIKEALKARIKELTSELSRAEKALAALETEKAPKAKTARSTAATPMPSSATGSATTAAKALADTVLLDGIVAQLEALPNGNIDAVAHALKLPKGKVNQAFKKLVAKGDIIVSGKQGRTKLYSLAATE